MRDVHSCIRQAAMLQSFRSRLGRSRLVHALLRLALLLTGSRAYVGNGKWLHVRPEDDRARRILAARRPLDILAVHALEHVCSIVKPDIVLDVGANYGESTLSGRLGSISEIHLFEPNPVVLTALRRTAEKYRSGQVFVHEVAASDQTGTARFKFSPTASGLGSISAEFEGQPQSAEVMMRRIDDLVDASGKRLVFKVDVEGSELRAMRGMEEALACAACFGGVCEVAHADETLRDYLLSRFAVFRLGKDDLSFVRCVKPADLLPRDGYTKDVLLLPRSTSIDEVAYA